MELEVEKLSLSKLNDNITDIQNIIFDKTGCDVSIDEYGRITKAQTSLNIATLHEFNILEDRVFKLEKEKNFIYFMLILICMAACVLVGLK